MHCLIFFRFPEFAKFTEFFFYFGKTQIFLETFMFVPHRSSAMLKSPTFIWMFHPDKSYGANRGLDRCLKIIHSDTLLSVISDSKHLIMSAERNTGSSLCLKENEYFLSGGFKWGETNKKRPIYFWRLFNLRMVRQTGPLTQSFSATTIVGFYDTFAKTVITKHHRHLKHIKGSFCCFVGYLLS